MQIRQKQSIQKMILFIVESFVPKLYIKAMFMYLFNF